MRLMRCREQRNSRHARALPAPHVTLPPEPSPLLTDDDISSRALWLLRAKADFDAAALKWSDERFKLEENLSQARRQLSSSSKDSELSSSKALREVQALKEALGQKEKALSGFQIEMDLKLSNAKEQWESEKVHLIKSVEEATMNACKFKEDLQTNQEQWDAEKKQLLVRLNNGPQATLHDVGNEVNENQKQLKNKLKDKLETHLVHKVLTSMRGAWSDQSAASFL